MFGSASSFASTAALGRSIEGACGMPRTFPRSKRDNVSYGRAFGACEANQEVHIATQYNIFEANQDTAEQSTASVQPIRREKIKQRRRDRPGSDALVFRAAPATPLSWSIGLNAICLFGLFDAATWLPVPDSRN
jgi:hypothetical protein